MSKGRTKRGKRKNQSSSSILILGIVVVVAAAILGVWWFNRAGSSATGLPTQISASEAFSKREAGAFILDVREPDEWQQFHVPGSTLVPLGELQNRVDELPREQEIVVVCRSGNRSQAGRDILLQAGFEQVTSMAGGLTEWRASGYPTVVGN